MAPHSSLNTDASEYKREDAAGLYKDMKLVI